MWNELKRLFHFELSVKNGIPYWTMQQKTQDMDIVKNTINSLWLDK